jgi:hypothetical protein
MSEGLMHVIGVVAVVLLAFVWIALWLWAANWKRLWPVLAEGGWAPALLLLLMAAVAWSRLQPGPCPFVPAVPGFAWQVAAVAILAYVALFCGWLQGRLGWAPPEVSVEPPAAEDDGHGHGHH